MTYVFLIPKTRDGRGQQVFKSRSVELYAHLITSMTTTKPLHFHFIFIIGIVLIFHFSSRLNKRHDTQHNDTQNKDIQHNNKKALLWYC